MNGIKKHRVSTPFLLFFYDSFFVIISVLSQKFKVLHKLYVNSRYSAPHGKQRYIYIQSQNIPHSLKSRVIFETTALEFDNHSFCNHREEEVAKCMPQQGSHPRLINSILCLLEIKKISLWSPTLFENHFNSLFYMKEWQQTKYKIIVWCQWLAGFDTPLNA